MIDADIQSYEDAEGFVREVIPDKSEVLGYMKSGRPFAAAAGGFEDPFTGDEVDELIAYHADGLRWDTRDIYFLENYDAKLSPDFLAAVRKLIAGKNDA